MKRGFKMELMRNNKTITIVDDIEMLDYLEKLGNVCIDTIEKQYPYIKLKNYFTFKLAELDNNITGSYYRIKTDLGKYLNRYVLIDWGKQVSFGYECGYRTNDHRIIFSCFEDIEYNDFNTLMKGTGLLMCIPETDDCWCLKGQRLSKEQKNFIASYDLNLIRE